MISRVALPNYVFQKNNSHERNQSFWSNVPMGPPDAIFGLTEQFKNDPDPNKVNLGVGAYRTNEGQPYRLPSVLKAEEIVLSKKLNKEYLPITGNSQFCDLAAKFVFGENSEITKNKLNISAQVLSGTGGLFIGAQLLKKFFSGPKVVYIPKPTWANHISIFKHADIESKVYRYYDEKAKWLNFDWIREDLCKIPEGSIILLQEVAQNPTGIDPSKEQWDILSQIVKHKKLLTFFDMAYQGFATGDSENDAYAVRKFTEDGNQLLVAQSCAKNFGLYGERIGALHITTNNQEQKAKVLSQLKIIIRACYSNPPLHGSRLVAEVLGNPELKKQWEQEVKCMASRIMGIRNKLVENLKKAGSKHTWDHIEKQIGMFCYSGLTPPQVEQIIKKHHIYMMSSGRISIAGVSDKNVEYIANAMHDVTK